MPKGALRVQLPDEELMFAGVAQLAMDRHDLGVRAWAPYVWDLPEEITGDKDLTLTITTTLLEQLEGKRYEPRSRSVQPIRTST